MAAAMEHIQEPFHLTVRQIVLPGKVGSGVATLHHSQVVIEHLTRAHPKACVHILLNGISA